MRPCDALGGGSALHVGTRLGRFGRERIARWPGRRRIISQPLLTAEGMRITRGDASHCADADLPMLEEFCRTAMSTRDRAARASTACSTAPGPGTLLWCACCARWKSWRGGSDLVQCRHGDPDPEEAGTGCNGTRCTADLGPHRFKSFLKAVDATVAAHEAAFDPRDEADVFLLDVSAAFPSIVHALLWRMLRALCVRP